MPIIAKAGQDFELCPAGTHAAVCVDVVDMGDVVTKFKDKEVTQHKIRIVWQIDEPAKDGRMHVAKRRYTLSLHSKSGLRKDLESWRGRPFTEEELRGFDVEAVIGAGAMLSVMHESKGDTTYDNVTAVMKPPKGMQIPKPDGTYIRVKDRKTEGQNAPPEGDWTASDDDIPF